MQNIIFDVDGTLWDTTEVVARAWSRAVSEVNGTAVDISGAVLKKEFGKTMDVIARDLFPDAGEENRELIMKKCCEYEHIYLSRETADLYSLV